MTLGLLLLPAVGGYWFVTHWNFTRFQAVRDSGYHVLFKAALCGIVLYCAAHLIAYQWNPIPEPVEFWDENIPAPFTSAVVLSIIFGFCAPYLLNVVYSKRSGTQRAMTNTGDYLMLLLMDAAREQFGVEISLRNRKTYVGVVLKCAAERTAESAVEMLPAHSGYRDDKTLQLNLDTNYRFVTEEYLRTPESFRVIIPFSDIVSARPFDFMVFERFVRFRRPPTVRRPPAVPPPPPTRSRPSR